jgi:DNA primase
MDNILFSLEDILGTSKKTSSGERLFHCPFCYHHKPKLSINFTRRAGYWKCWVCDESGKKISSLLYKLGYSRKEIKSILGEEEDTYTPEENPKEYKVNITLPREYKPLWRVTEKSYEYLNAIRFLKSRGVHLEDIYRYQIGYCEEGQYKNRIIIPSFDRNMQVNYFVSRTYYDGGMKYKNPPASRNNIIFENLINWKMPVVLVEGIFDAIAVRRNCVPLLGKILSDKLKQTLVNKKPPMVYIMLDKDAQKEALRIESYLKSVNVNVKLVVPTDKDAGEMGFEQSWVNINNAVTSNFTDLVGTKLEMV